MAPSPGPINLIFTTPHMTKNSWTHLGVLLLRARDVAGDVLHGRRVLVGEPVGLALHARLVDQHAAIGGWDG